MRKSQYRINCESLYLYRISKISYSKNTIFLIFIVLFLYLPLSVYSQSKTTYTPLNVGEHWSRKTVAEGNNTNRIYYKPKRFSYMILDTESAQTIQIRAISTHKVKTIEIKIKIDNEIKTYTLKVNEDNKNIFFTEPINIALPSDTKTISIYTRNPHVFFRHYKVNTRFLEPKVYTMKPINFKNIYMLNSNNSKSEYHSAISETDLVYTIEEDGDIHFFIRSIRTNRHEVPVEIYVNDNLFDTIYIKNSTSSDYTVEEMQVSTGRRINVPNQKKGNKLMIRPKTTDEIICRMFLSTKDLY